MKLLIADDSALITGILSHLFTNDRDIQVAGIARNGSMALEMARSLKPDVIIMDINMPVMNGLDATRLITAELGIPIVIFSNEINEVSAKEAFDSGALEVISKPDIGNLNDDDFIKKFRSLLVGLESRKKNITNHSTQHLTIPKAKISLAVMGASTGGPKTVRSILQELSADFPVPIILVQHLEKGFESGYVQWLDESTDLSVKLVSGTTDLKAGTVYVAPPELHVVLRDTQLYLDNGPRVLNQKPAVDVLFTSAAKNRGSSLLGILLTGMGRDGGQGCADIIRAGGYTIVQDEESSDIFGMPKAAIEMHGASIVLPLEKIPGEMMRLCPSKKPAGIHD